MSVITNRRMQIAHLAFNAIHEELKDRTGITDELKAAKDSVFKGRIIIATLHALGIRINKGVTTVDEPSSHTIVETTKYQLSNGGALVVTRKGRKGTKGYELSKHANDVYTFALDKLTGSLVTAGTEEIYAAMSA